MAMASEKEMDFFEKVGYVFSLWDDSLKALRCNLLTFVVLYVLPGLLLTMFLFLSIVPFLTAAANNNFSPFFYTTLFISIIGTIVLYVILYPAITYTQLQSVQNKKVSVTTAIKEGIRFVPAFIVYGIVVILAIMIPMLITFILMLVLIGFLLLPVVFIWALFIGLLSIMVPYVIVNENLGGLAALKRTYLLFKGNWQWFLAVGSLLLISSIVSPVPVIGQAISIVIAVVYFCMPVLVYSRFLLANHTATKVATSQVKPAKKTNKKAPAKRSVAKKNK